MPNWLDLAQFALNQSLPVALMFFGSAMTLLGSATKLWKLEVTSIGWKRFYAIAGTASFVVGFMFAVLQSYKSVFGAELSPPDWRQILTLRTLGVVLISFIITTLAWMIWRFADDRALALDGTPVSYGKEEANIRVEHKGGKSFVSYARLDSLTRVYEGKEEVLDINAVNPNGSFLSWNNLLRSATVRDGVPQIVNVFFLRPEKGYGKEEFRLRYYDDFSQELELSSGYRATVTLCRFRGKKLVPMKTVTGLCAVMSGGLAWIDENAN